MKYNFIFILFLFSVFQASAFSDTPYIPIYRVHFHDLIKEQQQLMDKRDGKEDGVFHAGSNENINMQLTDALYRHTNELRFWIEKNEKIASNNDKVRYLKYLENVLNYFRINWNAREITPLELPLLLTNADDIMRAKAESKSILPLLQPVPYNIAKINANIFSEEEDRAAIANVVYLKYTTLHPEKILQSISPFAKEAFADSLIIVACKKNPVQFYSYAQSISSTVGKLIHQSKDPMVAQVAKLSGTENALFYFPFLDDILSGKKNIDSLKKLVGNGEKGYDSVGYYRLLVKTATEYFRRMQAKDTAVAYFGANGLLATLRYRDSLHFISRINELHNENNLAIRMKAIQPLTPAELYYSMVFAEDIIYTSSYKHSFNRMLQAMGNKPRGDSLLLAVGFDRYRKFIKMAANYNKLDTFLKTMPAARAEMVMNSFVANLDKTGNLEDAVDVADSYSSITDISLKKALLKNVGINESKAIAENNKSGTVIYGLLKAIFKTADGDSTNLSAQLGIPSIYELPVKELQDEKGRIVQQVFWYGDKDGKQFYPQFKNSFSPREWKVTEKKEWMEAVSLKGNVIIFANRPLDNDANLDDTAQIHLAAYMQEKGLKPAVTVHRGHSYWLPRTLDRMAGDAKIVVLGSCGGYQNLSKILGECPDAHIISTKEIGAGDINRPILNYMNNAFASSTVLSWRAMWASLTKTFYSEANKSIRESWDDYIPPYKNLGAIFLKAYSKKIEVQ